MEDIPDKQPKIPSTPTQGRGRYQAEDGILFEGTFENGVPQGVGTSTWPNGNAYYGDFVNGNRNGNGTFVWASTGDIFQGQFSNGKRHGVGIYWYANGDKYEGEWNHSKIHGKGLFYVASKRSFYDCSWVEGEAKEGVFVNGQGYIYEGPFLNRKPHGQGIYTWPHGKSKRVQFNNGEIDRKTMKSIDYLPTWRPPPNFLTGLPTPVPVLPESAKKIQPIPPPMLPKIKASEEAKLTVSESGPKPQADQSPKQEMTSGSQTSSSPTDMRSLVSIVEGTMQNDISPATVCDLLIESDKRLSSSAPATGSGKIIFTIHLPYGGKKSIMLNNANLDQTVKTLLEPILKQRGLGMNDYLAMKVDGKVVSLNTKLRIIEPREIVLTGVNDVFTVFLPHGGKKSVILNPIQTLRNLLEKICNVRNIALQDVVAYGSDGKVLDLDVVLANIEEHSVTLGFLKDVLNNAASPLPEVVESPKQSDIEAGVPLPPQPQRKETNGKKKFPRPRLHFPKRKEPSEEVGEESISPRNSGDIPKPKNKSKKKEKILKSKNSQKGMKVERSEDGETDVTDTPIDGNLPTGEREAESADNTLHSPSILVSSEHNPPTVTKEPFKISESLLETLADSEFTGYPYPVFGVSLDLLCTPEQPIPYLIRAVVKCLLTEEAIMTQGLFRIPGSQDDIQIYRKLFDEGKEVTFKNCSYHDVAGLLKEFLRKLPDPLIPTLYNQQVRHIVEEHKTKENIDEQQLLASLKEVIEQLPRENLEILQILVKFLSHIVAHADVNMMTIDNIIKCIVPSVGCYPAIFYYTLTHIQYFFGDKTTGIENNELDRRGRRRDQQGVRRGNRTYMVPSHGNGNVNSDGNTNMDTLQANGTTFSTAVETGVVEGGTTNKISNSDLEGSGTVKLTDTCESLT